MPKHSKFPKKKSDFKKTSNLTNFKASKIKESCNCTKKSEFKKIYKFKKTVISKNSKKY